MKGFAAGLFMLAIVVGVGAAIVVGGNELAYRQTAHYAPRYEAVRRGIFEQSRAFQEGTIRDLDNLRLEYARGDTVQREAIADVARHRLADLPVDQLPASLQAFARQVGAAP